MIYIAGTIIALIALLIIRAMMRFDPNKKNKASKEKLDRQIDEYIDMLKKYQDKKKN